MKLKKTTLLVIGVVLLWGAVAVWNGVQRGDARSSSKPVTSVHSGGAHPSPDRQTATNSSQRVNIATH
jgi:hypothetical protein